LKPLPKSLKAKLEERETSGALRRLHLKSTEDRVDFYSNDYLGFSFNEKIKEHTAEFFNKYNFQSGSTGSRLLSGNHDLYKVAEEEIANFHSVPKALIFNSGYNANIGFFGAVPQRNDIVFYDALIHASIRDGLLLCKAKSYNFEHNNLKDLQEKLERITKNDFKGEIYVVIESVYSMDGDSPDLEAFANFCETYNLNLVVDEAHALGVFGAKGEGLVQQLGLQHKVFAQIMTFGKALGVHGAAILCSEDLYVYLVNFARSLIYTTALPPHALAVILSGYKMLASLPQKQIQFNFESVRELNPQENLRQNIDFFKSEIKRLALTKFFIPSNSSIHCCVVSGNEQVKAVAVILKTYKFEVKPILSPTVPKNQERLRFCLHSFNSFQQITKVLKIVVNTI